MTVLRSIPSRIKQLLHLLDSSHGPVGNVLGFRRRGSHVQVCHVVVKKNLPIPVIIMMNMPDCLGHSNRLDLAWKTGQMSDPMDWTRRGKLLFAFKYIMPDSRLRYRTARGGIQMCRTGSSRTPWGGKITCVLQTIPVL